MKVGRRGRRVTIKVEGKGEKGYYKGWKERERRVTIKVGRRGREGLL